MEIFNVGEINCQEMYIVQFTLPRNSRDTHFVSTRVSEMIAVVVGFLKTGQKIFSLTAILA